jgi:glutamyl/glutaminyl-tRNA synthetase
MVARHQKIAAVHCPLCDLQALVVAHLGLTEKTPSIVSASVYTGRLAPSPTGRLHLGHARTFLCAAERARAAGGRLLMRMDDLDGARSRAEFAADALADLAWLGLRWEQPVVVQSTRLPLYRSALQRLHAAKLIFPCHRSRRDLAEALSAPHEEQKPAAQAAHFPDGDATNDEPVYPKTWRPQEDSPLPPLDDAGWATNWRFRVPDRRQLVFNDGFFGPQVATTGMDFGDFVVWRKDGLPSYQLACAVDDSALGITEVVRGADLIRSTFRQLLLLEALGSPPPSYWHVPLMKDEAGVRLAKRNDSLSLSTLRENGLTPEELRAKLACATGPSASK